MFIQRGNNNFEIEISGAAPFVNTYSTEYDGVDDYVDCGNSAALKPNIITVSCWIKGSTQTAFTRIVSQDGPTGGADAYGFYVTTALNKVVFAIKTDVTGTVTSATSGVVLDNSWHHLVGTYDGSEVILYVDGVAVGSPSAGTSILSYGSGTLTIGCFSEPTSLPSYLFNGNIDEVSIFNSVIPIGDLWDGSGVPTDLTDLSPIAWYRMGDNGVYKSPQWLLPSNENKDKVSNYSFEFDGLDDRVQLSSDFVASGEFTISFWMKPVSIGSPAGKIYPIGTFPGNDNYIKLDQVGVMWLRFGGATTIYNEAVVGGGANNLVADEWQHVMFIRDSSNVLRCYRNGATFGGPVTNASVLTLNSFGRIISNSFGFEGGLDEIAFWNSDETANLSTIYNGGEPTTLPSGAVAHYKLGEEANFTSNWLVDNSALTNYSKRSFEFDGIDDYISVTPNPLTDFTVSFWIKPSSGVGASFDGILGQGTTSPQGGILRYVAYDGTGSVGNVLVRLAAWTNVSGSITNGVWTNVVLTYDSVADELKGYNNGSLYTTISNPDFSAQTTNAHSFERIGLRNGLNGTEFNGGIDEVAVWDSALTDISSIYNGGTPTTISGAVAHWRMGEDASFDGTNWTLPDNVGSNNGTSNAMTVDSLVGEAANYSGGGISNAMTIEDRVGNAPNSDNNALSYNMESVDRTTDVPT